MHRNDPAFYVDGSGHTLVKTLERRNGRQVHIYCDGEMRLRYTHPDGTVSTIRYADDLPKYGIHCDDDLKQLEHEERIVWDNNAWFDLYVSVGGLYEEHWDCVRHWLPDAHDEAEMILYDNRLWIG